jgi:hypothetical protein
MRFSSNGYFFFFLAAFFAFAFFAFLAMLRSVIPKVGSMQVDNRHAYIQSTPSEVSGIGDLDGLLEQVRSWDWQDGEQG